VTGPCLIEELSWPEIATLVQAGERLCVLPVGATEQHGRHLPTGTDSLLIEAFCREASARTGVPLLPTLRVSSSHAHTTAWPGTLSFPPRLLADVVVELAMWVRASGFEKLLIVNGHAGNPAPLKVAVEELRWRGTLQVGLAHWFTLNSEIQAAVERDACDWHANAAETSLMLHLRPDLVRRSEIRDDPDRTTGLAFSYTVAQTSVDGLTGTPSAGSAEDGRTLFETVVSALCELVERARGESPPDLSPPSVTA
jgi:creatinine amidohydrolase